MSSNNTQSSDAIDELPSCLSAIQKAEYLPVQRHRWNTNEEIASILINFEKHQEWLSKEVKIRPKSGSMILYNRKRMRYRRDGYCWKKRKDGKTTREDHMKLKVQGTECIYGCYVHSSILPTFHRRCYWLLKNSDIVLVHYLNVPYTDDNKVINPTLNYFSDTKKEWTREELIAELKPMFFSENEPDFNNELELFSVETIDTIVQQFMTRQRAKVKVMEDTSDIGLSARSLTVVTAVTDRLNKDKNQTIQESQTFESKVAKTENTILFKRDLIPNTVICSPVNSNVSFSRSISNSENVHIVQLANNTGLITTSTTSSPNVGIVSKSTLSSSPNAQRPLSSSSSSPSINPPTSFILNLSQLQNGSGLLILNSTSTNSINNSNNIGLASETMQQPITLVYSRNSPVPIATKNANEAAKLLTSKLPVQVTPIRLHPNHPQSDLTIKEAGKSVIKSETKEDESGQNDSGRGSQETLSDPIEMMHDDCEDDCDGDNDDASGEMKRNLNVEIISFPLSKCNSSSSFDQQRKNNPEVDRSCDENHSNLLSNNLSGDIKSDPNLNRASLPEICKINDIMNDDSATKIVKSYKSHHHHHEEINSPNSQRINEQSSPHCRSQCNSPNCSSNCRFNKYPHYYNTDMHEHKYHQHNHHHFTQYNSSSNNNSNNYYHNNSHNIHENEMDPIDLNPMDFIDNDLSTPDEELFNLDTFEMLAELPNIEDLNSSSSLNNSGVPSNSSSSSSNYHRHHISSSFACKAPDSHGIFQNHHLIQGGVLSPMVGESTRSPTFPTSSIASSNQCDSNSLCEICDFSPEWSPPEGGIKLLLIGPWYSTSANYTVLFNGQSVPCSLIYSGVIRCHTPSHEPGFVSLQVALNATIISKPVIFEYRHYHQSSSCLLKEEKVENHFSINS